MNTSSPGVHVVILHGCLGHPGENWFPWLKHELESREVKVSVPKFPTPDGHTIHKWCEAFSEQVGKISSEMILIGHSLGSPVAMRLLERSDTVVRATIHVAGYCTEIVAEEFNPLIAPFIDTPFDWERIKRNTSETFVIAGTDDPYVGRENTEELSRHLAVPIEWIDHGGHLNTSAGYSEFPFLLEKLESLGL